MGTGDEGVQSFNLMNKAMFDQEVERPIRDRWLRAETFEGKFLEDIVCPKCRM
jgi:hypothetical protein